MIIKSGTTDDEIMEPVRKAREALSKAAAEFAFDATRLADLLNAIAYAEGQAHVRAVLRDGLQYGASVESLTNTLLQIALGSPDDTWSGRTNDVRRSIREGVREEVKRLTEFGNLRRIVGE